MIQIGITGGIGSGKSTISNIFKVLGIPVFDADKEAKKIMVEDENLKEKIIELFGKESYLHNTLNNKHIASIVFNDPYKLEQLNAVVHPAAIDFYEKWVALQTTKYVIKEAALMFEVGTTKNLNYVIGVYAPKHIRLQRVMQRDNTTKEQVEARMNHQIDETLKMKLCDFVITNDEQKLVLPQVLELHEKFMKM